MTKNDSKIKIHCKLILRLDFKCNKMQNNFKSNSTLCFIALGPGELNSWKF